MKTTITLLPDAVQHYLEAANHFDDVAAADCFTPDASVRDENQDYPNREAIRAWVAETSRKYRPTFTLLRASVNGAHVGLAVAVSGQFPGSPVTLDYAFELRDGKIAALTID